MGLRFQKRIKIAPGLRINLSLRRGISASVGPRGASHNIGLDGRQRTTIGAPGTGLSYSHDHPTAPHSRARGASALGVAAVLLALLFVGYLVLRN